MGASAVATPPLPPGFVLDAPTGGVPPLPPGFTLDAKPEPSVGKRLIQRAVGMPIAVGENALSLMGGGLGTVLGGLHGVQTGVGNLLGLSKGDPAKDIATTQHAVSYTPKSEMGKSLHEAISWPFQKWGQGTEAAGNALLDAGAPHGIASAVKTAGDLAPAALGKVPAVGAVTDALIEAGQKGVSAVSKGVGKAANLVTKEGPRRMVLDGLKDNIIGQENVPRVADALSKVETLIPERAPVPGAQGPTLPASKATVAEALAGDPVGTALQAHQKTTLAQPGGPSVKAADRLAEQNFAREAAKAERAAVTSPMREAALENANIANRMTPKLEADIAAKQEAVVNALQDQGRFGSMATGQASRVYQTPGLQPHIPGWLSSTLDTLQQPGTFRFKSEMPPNGELRSSIDINAGRPIARTLEKVDEPLKSAADIGRLKTRADELGTLPPPKEGFTAAHLDRTAEARTAQAEAADLVSTRKSQRDLSQYALDSLKAHGLEQLKSAPLVGSIKSISGSPGLRASDVVTKSLGDIGDKIQSLTSEHGTIHPKDLYMIRKEAGNVIEKYAQENKNFDQRLTAGLVKDVQKHIDDAIEKAGGIGWKDYLAKYADMSKGIDADILRSETMYKPAQPTNVGGPFNPEAATAHVLPNIFSKAITESKWGLGVLARLRSKAVQDAASDYYLHPEKLAADLKDVPQQRRGLIVNALLKQAAPYAAAGAMGRSQQ